MIGIFTAITSANTSQRQSTTRHRPRLVRPTTVFGKPHETLVVTMTMTVGPKKIGVELKQVWRYAADVGLYEVTEDGHIGKNQVHHTRRLT